MNPGALLFSLRTATGAQRARRLSAAGKGEPPTPKGLKAREKMLKAAGEVFYKGGYGRSGVADICAAADMAVGGFYRYFSGKEEVLETILAGLETDLAARIKGLPECGSAREEVEAVAVLYFGFVAENKEVYQVMREAEFVCARASRKFYDTLAAAAGARLAKYGAGLKANEVSVYTLIGMLSFIAVKNILWLKKPVPRGTAAAVAEVFMNGVSRQKPDLRALIEKAASLKKAQAAKTPGGDTCSRLLASSELVFGGMGYGPAHISEVTRHAGYAAGTFYTCFKSKKEALDRLVLALRNELVSRAVLYSSGSASRTQTEVLAFIALFDFISEHPYGYRIMREAEFVDFRLAEDFYIYILNAYTAKMRETARPGEFTIKDCGLLSLMMMGIGHMLGLKYALWSAKGPGKKEMESMLARVFSGWKNPQ